MDNPPYKADEGGMHFTSQRRMGEVRVPNYVYDLWLPLLGAETISVYALYCRLEREGWVRGLSLERLKEVCRIGKSGLIAINQTLEACGFISITRPEGTQRSRHYTLAITVLDPPMTVSAGLIARYGPPFGYQVLTPWLLAEDPQSQIGPPAVPDRTAITVPDRTAKIASPVASSGVASSIILPASPEPLSSAGGDIWIDDPVTSEIVHIQPEPTFHPVPKPGAFRPEPEREPLDDDGEPISGGRGKRPKSQLPDDPFQVRLLEACHAKYFQPGQKTKAKAIHNALRAGEIIADDVQRYERCLVAARSTGEKDVPQVMPWSWYGWREEQAREHHWSVWGFINALSSPDLLVKHCQFMLRAKRTIGGKGEQADPTGSGSPATRPAGETPVDDYTAQYLAWQNGTLDGGGSDDEAAGLDLP